MWSSTLLDEIGYLPVTQDGAVLFFQLINARHERASTVLTSNKGFEEWGTVLGEHPGQQLPDAGAPGLAAGGDGEAPRGNREMTVGPAGIIGTVAAGRAGAL